MTTQLRSSVHQEKILLYAIYLIIFSSIFIPNFVDAQSSCSIALATTVSGCYQNSGSKATVSIEVSWLNAPSGDSIIVSGPVGSIPATRTIKPGSMTVNYTSSITGQQVILSPQVVAFEIPSNATTGLSVSAKFANHTTCKATSGSFNSPAPCLISVCSTGNLGGTVYNDYNANGKREAGETSGVSNIIIKAYACDGTVYKDTTDIFGVYSMGIPATKYPVRVEFLNLPTYAGMGTVHGDDSKTTVQFVYAPNCTVDLGILNSSDYCQSTPDLAVPCYVFGDPLPAGSKSGTMDAFVSFPYGTSGPENMMALTLLATASQVGTIWGVAYNKYNHKLYSSAVLKRHAGLGPLGLGGIYVTDFLTHTTSNFVDVTAALGINVGSIPSNVARGLVTDPTKQSADSLAFAAIGKSGIGDLEVSEDGRYLYFTNLFDQKLYKLDISGASPTLAGSYKIPSGSGWAGGNNRPFGLKVFQGKVYVGTICDAATSKSKSNLRASILSFDPSSATFTEVLNFPLTYPKGPVLVKPNPTVINDFVAWNPWTDIFDEISTHTQNGTTTRLIHPQPIITDIEFDIDGSMIIALGDRTGIQTGFNNYRPSGNGDLFIGFSGGDILRATYNGSSFILENNAKIGGKTGYGKNNNQGPGFGEFYDDDFLASGGGLNHSEIAFGALALKPGSGQVAMTSMDPLNADYGGTNNSGGIRYLNNSTGLAAPNATMAYVIYNSNNDIGTFAKSTGLGDLEVTCDLPTYLELGNRVWLDANKDGVQDACEKGLANVNVKLYKGANLIASTTTNSEGEYYFSSKSKNTLGVWTGTGADTTLIPNTKYTIAFGAGGQMSSNGDTLKITGLGTFLLTKQNSILNNGNDQNDSDAFPFKIASNILPVDTISTTNIGEVNHTLDAGFYCISATVENKIAIIAPNCTGNTDNNNGKIQLISSNLPFTKFRVKIGSGSWVGDSTFATATSIGTVFPKDLKSSIPNAGAIYKIRFYIGECCYKDTLITVDKVNCSCPPPITNIELTQTNSGCINGVDQKNGKITLGTKNIGDKFGISSLNAQTYDGASYSTAQTSVSSQDIISGLPNSNASYIVRIYNGSNLCFTDTTISFFKLFCATSPCVLPTLNSTTSIPASCSGGMPLNDAQIIFNATNGDKFDYVLGTSTASLSYANATPLSTGNGKIAGLPNPSTPTSYTIRVFNSNNNCFLDSSVTILPKTCCFSPNCGTVTVTKN